MEESKAGNINNDTTDLPFTINGEYIVLWQLLALNILCLTWKKYTYNVYFQSV